MKSFLKLAGVLLFFIGIGMATTKKIDFVCYAQIDSYLYKQDSGKSYYFTNTRDTIVIRTYKDTLWEKRTQELCKLIKDSCNAYGFKIVVVDTSFTNMTTPYGHQIYFRQCP